ncbi:hydroxyacid dehydrogenase [Ktedonosporobacter rubrisoli]|uniref:Hydroxyacid dehydrogenase n=1 Tax=Ktedonosporobacter rubrisoli TaxID=2509675 RepID=A0A4P6JMT9_KTERU|nr:NAD(P)-dependent oxidoreductase [Ktedonosporobacter rubrisoli]QBD76352.1 hydroxyacid dehydrogenase [Ktedonosporobacter rubrisoli]
MENNTQQNSSLVHALATTVNEEDGRYLNEHLGHVLSLRLTPALPQDMPASELSEVEILIPFVNTRIGREEIDAMPRLQLIATRSTGYDHIDTGYAAERGIAVANVPGYGETAVAEYTFALLLALSRKLRRILTRQNGTSIEELRGFDLHGKTLGVVGTGAIGLNVIRIANGFGMQVLAYDVRKKHFMAELLNFRYLPLPELLTDSDIITLHVPSLASTYHLLNRQNLPSLKPGALLINTARGTLVETEALVEALDNGILSGAGLDTLEGEEFLQAGDISAPDLQTDEQRKLLELYHSLQQRENVIITPHIAFASKEALKRILDTTIENVLAFLEGRSSNLVTPKAMVH